MAFQGWAMNLLRLLLSGRLPPILVTLALSLASGSLMTITLAYVSNLLTDKVNRVDTAVIFSVAGLAIGVSAAAFFAGIIGSWVVQANAAALRRDVCEAILKANFAKLERGSAVIVMDLLASRLPLVVTAASRLPETFVHGAVLVGLYGWMATLSLTITVAIIVIQALFLIGMGAFFSRFRDNIVHNQNDREILTGHYIFIDAARKYMSLYPALADDFLLNNLSNTIEHIRHGSHRVNVMAVAADSLAKASFFATLVVMLAGVAFFPYILPHDTALTVLIAYLFSVVPLTTVLNSVQTISEGEVAYSAIIAATSDIETNHAVCETSTENYPKFTDSMEVLTFTNISFQYPDREEDRNFAVMIDNLALNPGEVLTITGPNGSGKSTVGKIITGMYEPKQGQIVLGNIMDVCDGRKLRSLFAAIWCDDRQTRFYIGPHTIGFNSIPDLWAILELTPVLAPCCGWIDCAGLSTGQRMRVALLSALTQGRRYFLFDEFAANQDERFAAVFYYDVIPALRTAGCTVVIIAHDSVSTRIADTVRTMNHGHIDAVIDLTAARGELVHLRSKKGIAP
jgi:ABC-type siderophore export system fused ATPase/permease subunit